MRKALSDGNIKFLTEEQALLLQAVNGLRDAAQHHLLDIGEPLLYFHAQAGLTLFRDLLRPRLGSSRARERHAGAGGSLVRSLRLLDR